MANLKCEIRNNGERDLRKCVCGAPFSDRMTFHRSGTWAIQRLCASKKVR
jgi:hypothetical protein